MCGLLLLFFTEENSFPDLFILIYVNIYVKNWYGTNHKAMSAAFTGIGFSSEMIESGYEFSFNHIAFF